MLLFTVLATLLCSSFVNALKVPVNSAEALKLCHSEGNCDNDALDINPSTFVPTINVPGVENLNLAVKKDQPLTLPIKAEKDHVTWEITRPDSDKCLWKISSVAEGTVKFEEWIPGKEKPEFRTSCTVDVGRAVDISIRSTGTRYSVDVKGKCDSPPRSGTLSACDYAPPDSTSSPGWQIWRLSVSASPSDSTASITLTNAFVVYDAPDPTTPMAAANSNASMSNDTTPTPGNHTTPHNSAALVDLSITTYALIVVSALLAVL